MKHLLDICITKDGMISYNIVKKINNNPKLFFKNIFQRRIRVDRTVNIRHDIS